MKYRAIDLYENPHGDLVFESDNLLSVLYAAEGHCIDTDDECNIVIQTNTGVDLIAGNYYSEFTPAIELLRGLYRAGIIKQEDKKNE